MKFLVRKPVLALSIAVLSMNTNVAQATVWTTSIQSGTATFDDWGYTGPDGRTAVDFAPVNGFGGLAEGNALDPFGGVGQIQHVVTTGPDNLTPDSPYSVIEDLGGSNLYLDSNIDSRVNFYEWGYTTVAGSRFENMQIDYDGDYYIDRNDMAFNYYRTFDYVNMDPSGPLAFLTPPDGDYQTNIQFQPYAVSDAIGWCGSVMATNPGSLEAMAGQVTFDFAFEAFFGNQANPNPGVPGTGSLQIVPDFQMRSYGSLTIDVTVGSGATAKNFVFTADAVVNNTNPTAGTINPATGLKEVGGTGVDEDYYNKVSFMGGGSVPSSLFIQLSDLSTYDSTGFKVTAQGKILNILDSADVVGVFDEVTGEFIEARDAVTGAVLPNVVFHTNSFASYPFLLRADGDRVIDAFDFSFYNDFSDVPSAAYVDGVLVNTEGVAIVDLSTSAVPVPAAVWLFGSGLITLAGFANRRRSV